MIKEDNLQVITMWASLTVALTLFTIKIAGWFFTGSLSIFSSMTDSMLDGFTSMINLLAVSYALRPADKEHSFGHNSVEDIAGLFQAAFIAGSALFIVFQAIYRLIVPTEISNDIFGIGIMIISLVMTTVLVTFQKYVIKRTGAIVVRADSLHYVGDILMNAAVILSLLVFKWFGWVIFDPIIALLISAYMLYGTWQIGKSAFDNLMDREFRKEKRQKVIDIVNLHKGIMGFHDLKTRASGSRSFIQLHVEIDSNLSMIKAHDIADSLEKKLEKAFPKTEVIVHQDPYHKRRLAPQKGYAGKYEQHA